MGTLGGILVYILYYLLTNVFVTGNVGMLCANCVMLLTTGILPVDIKLVFAEEPIYYAIVDIFYILAIYCISILLLFILLMLLLLLVLILPLMLLLFNTVVCIFNYLLYLIVEDVGTVVDDIIDTLLLLVLVLVLVIYCYFIIVTPPPNTGVDEDNIPVPVPNTNVDVDVMLLVVAGCTIVDSSGTGDDTTGITEDIPLLLNDELNILGFSTTDDLLDVTILLFTTTGDTACAAGVTEYVVVVLVLILIELI